MIKDNQLEEFALQLRVLMNDEDLRERMGKAAKVRIQEKFSKEMAMKEWKELFGE